MTMKRILPAACVAAIMSAGSAHAFLIDFTADPPWTTPSAASTTKTVSYTGVAGIGSFDVTLTSFGGPLDFDQRFDGPGSASYCSTNGGDLACVSDGGGVDGSAGPDDEIAAVGIAGTQRIEVTFSKALKVTGYHFLDLFKSSGCTAASCTETALIEYGDYTGSADETVPAVEFAGSNGGYEFFADDAGLLTKLVFSVGAGKDDGSADYALAGIGVVPLPAAGWLLVGAFGGLYGARRLKKKS